MKFAVKEFLFLGHIVYANSVRIDPERTGPIDRFSPPKNAKEIARFLVMVNFFPKFSPNLSELAALLNALRRKGVTFLWTDKYQTAF